jgi:hypothetical protein
MLKVCEAVSTENAYCSDLLNIHNISFLSLLVACAWLLCFSHVVIQILWDEGVRLLLDSIGRNSYTVLGFTGTVVDFYQEMGGILNGILH